MSGFNLSEWALKHRSITIYLMILAVLAGVASYYRLGRSEDPSFIIKTMVVQAQWPGATTEETLKQVAARTGGKYYRADSTKTMRSIYAEIDKMEKTEMEARRFAAWEEWMVLMAWPAVGLLVLEMALSHTVWRKLP